jgi:uncharacterized protein YdhG (YjbR/CyaY superfamily)
MDTRDRALLADIVHFTHINHLSSAYLYRSILNRGNRGLEEAARYALAYKQPNKTPRQIARSVKKYHDAARIEKILKARIYAEMISSYEDLGELGWAIFNRAQGGGIFFRLVKGNTGEAGSFFEHVLKLGNPAVTGTTLGKYLKLKSVDKFTGKVPANILEAIQYQYRALADHIYLIAKKYREVADQVQANDAGGATILPTWENDVNVLLAFVLPDEQVAAGPTYVEAFNKIKHGFLITERLPDYDVSNSPAKIRYARIKSSPEDMLESTCFAATIMAEIAALLLHLDAAGIRL